MNEILDNTKQKVVRMVRKHSAMLWAFLLLVLNLLTLFGPMRIYAQGKSVGKRLEDFNTELSDPSTVSTQNGGLSGLVNLIMKVAIPLGVLAVFILFAQTAFLMITSQGNPEKLKEAKEVATNAIIGFLLVALASTILVLVNNMFNLGI